MILLKQNESFNTPAHGRYLTTTGLSMALSLLLYLKHSMEKSTAINPAIHDDIQFTEPGVDVAQIMGGEHMTYRLVDELEPIVQGHTIEGLMMGEA